jgi:hypothetical protein
MKITLTMMVSKPYPLSTYSRLLLALDFLGSCVVDLVSIQLPDGVPLFLDLPLVGVSRGSVQLEITLQALGH